MIIKTQTRASQSTQRIKILDTIAMTPLAWSFKNTYRTANGRLVFIMVILKKRVFSIALHDSTCIICTPETAGRGIFIQIK